MNTLLCFFFLCKEDQINEWLWGLGKRVCVFKIYDITAHPYVDRNDPEEKGRIMTQEGGNFE